MTLRLVDAGANINLADHVGFTPLHEAALLGHTNITRLLIAYGSDLDIEDKAGLNPHSIALREGHIEVAQLLAACSDNPAIMNGWVRLDHYNSQLEHIFSSFITAPRCHSIVCGDEHGCEV
eukprot:m.118131 g.118131  ORF g.118131 m.118131 type:complete len:121 (+) comp13642_c2_seq1:301-663(+)